ncbi:MAG: hypothetical protein ACC652_11230, partial [Acidimicrobiales bacterium]
LNVSFNFCMNEYSTGYDLDEFDDRVVVQIKGERINADCTSEVLVSLTQPLRNRLVIVGSPARTFEFCGSDTLCRS